MSYSSPLQVQQQFRQYDTSTPPAPPPKPSTHSSGQATPLAGPPRPPPPGAQYQNLEAGQIQSDNGQLSPSLSQPSIPPPQDGWLPTILKDKSTLDLQALLQDPSLQQSLIHSPETAHPSLPASSAQLQSLLDANIALATTLKSLEAQIQSTRSATQSRLLALRALEGQWRTKQSEQDAALRDFSPPALYQRLAAAVGEQEQLCRGLENSFVDAEGVATEREIQEFVRQVRESRKLAYLRAEAKERWDEGRVMGMR
jgi:hypothetical protein